eukprot:g50432.t1
MSFGSGSPDLRDHLAALFKAAEDNRRDEMARILGIEQGPEPKVEPSKVEVFDTVHATRGTIPHARRLFGVEFEREDLSRQLLKGVAESKIDVVEKALKGRAVLSHLRKTGWKRSRFKDLADLEKQIKELKELGLNKLNEEKSKLEEKIQNCEAEEERKQLSSELENILVNIGKIKRQIKQKEKEKNELLQKYTCDICKEFLDEAVKTKCGRYCWDCWQDWAHNKCWAQDNRSKKPLCPNPIDCSCRGTCEPMESEREEINKLKVIKACEFRCGESGRESVDAKNESKKYCSLSEYKKHRDQCEKNPGREQRKEEAPPIVMMWPDLCLQDGEGQDALYKAAGMGKLKIVKMLIEAVTNADPKKRAELLGNRYSCRRWISLLRVSNGSLRSPLHVASRGGHLQVVGLLLKEQADLRATTQAGSCPLSYAVQNKDWLMTHMLLVAGSDITTETLNDLKMTQIPTWFPKLLNAEEEKAPLVVAIRSNYRIEEVAKKLRNATKDEVNDSLLDGTTPLLAACSKPSEEEAKWLVQSLVEKNADVNKPGFTNNSPLLAACEKGHFKLALYLLKAGSRWDEQDVEGRTPLSVLSWRSQDADELIEYLHMCLKIFSIQEKDLETFDQLENFTELGFGDFGVVVEAKYAGQAHAVKFPRTTKNQKIRHLRRSTEDGQYSVSSNPDQRFNLSATTAPSPTRLARKTPHEKVSATSSVDTLAAASPFGSRSSEFYLDFKHEQSTASPQNRESNERRRIYSEFLHEALVCTRVGYKKNVVPFCGANLSLDKEPFLVFEKMPGNSVHKHLFSYKNEPPLDEWCKKYHPWIYRALPQAASGLLALHMEGVVHRDVRAHNFLVGASYIEESKGGDASQETKNRADPDSRIRQKIYISDFGLSQMLKKEKKEGKASEEFKEDGTLTYPTPYPWMWTAPEILQHDIRFSKKSDVYMFGMFIYSPLSLDVPHNAFLERTSVWICWNWDCDPSYGFVVIRH